MTSLAVRRRHRAWQPVLRAVTALVTLDGLAQAMFAGRFMAGSYDGLDAHSLNGIIMVAAMLVMTLCFTAAWRFGAASGRAALLCAVLTVATGAESALGHQEILAVHVPLGVALIAGLFAVTVHIWRQPEAQPEGRPVAGGDEQSRPESRERPMAEHK
jgi:hypothetical protein